MKLGSSEPFTSREEEGPRMIVGNTTYNPRHLNVPHKAHKSNRVIKDWIYRDVNITKNGNFRSKGSTSYFKNMRHSSTRCYICCEDSTTLSERPNQRYAYAGLLFCDNEGCNAMQHFAVKCAHPECADAPFYTTDTIGGGYKPQTIAALPVWFCCRKHQETTVNVTMVYREDTHDETEYTFSFQARIGVTGSDLVDGLINAIQNNQSELNANQLELVTFDSPRTNPTVISEWSRLALIDMIPNALDLENGVSFAVMHKSELKALRTRAKISSNMTMGMDSGTGIKVQLEEGYIPPHGTTIPDIDLVEDEEKKKKKKKKQRKRKRKRNRNQPEVDYREDVDDVDDVEVMEILAAKELVRQSKERETINKKCKSDIPSLKPSVTNGELLEWLCSFGYPNKTLFASSEIQPRNFVLENLEPIGPCDNYVMIVLNENTVNKCADYMPMDYLSPVRKRQSSYGIYYLIVPFSRGETGHQEAETFSDKCWRTMFNNSFTEDDELTFLRNVLTNNFQINLTDSNEVDEPIPMELELEEEEEEEEPHQATSFEAFVPPPLTLPLTNGKLPPLPLHMPISEDGRMRMTQSMPSLMPLLQLQHDDWGFDGFDVFGFSN